MKHRIPSGSPDLTQENIEKMKDLFPEIVTEGKIDFDMLKTLLGEEADDRNERYRFEWHGKKQSILGAQQPSKGTLRPDLEKSKNFDVTENLYIEGDNLEVLKLLQKSYNGKVKMIYIDPPYNTGNDFIYPDNFRDSINSYYQITGQVNSEGKKLVTNTENSGRFHTEWLNMMYPRLRIAKNLLTEDGVICISIDDEELHNLKAICNEIFGEKNFEGHIHWRRRSNQPNDPTKMIGLVAEHIIVYSRNSRYLKEVGVGKIDVTANFSNPDNDPLGEWASKPWKVGSGQSGSKYSITYPTGKVVEGEWMGNEKTFRDLLENNKIYFPNNGNGDPRKKYYKFERLEEGQCATNWWNFEQFGSNQDGSKQLSELMDDKKVFDNPKPTKLLRSLMQLCNLKSGDICLDFFSGSGSTAEALFQLNSEDNGSRRFILIQMAENLAEMEARVSGKAKKSIQNALDFLNSLNKPPYLTEIAQERISRAGEKITEELPDGVNSLDVGFKVFKLDKSNIQEWNIDFENIEQDLLSFEDVFVSGRTEVDIVYEIMLKYGLELTYPVHSFQIEGKNIYDIAFGNLFICLDKNINTQVAQAIIDKRNEYGIETSSVVFADRGFHGNDSEKLNCFKLLQDAGYHDEQLMTI